MSGLRAVLEFCILQSYKDVTLLSQLPKYPKSRALSAG